MKRIQVLCLSGSLRKISYNTAVLHAMSRLVPAHMDIMIFDGMGELPLFNPDRDEEYIIEVAALRDAVKRSDGLIIASPEYAHGITGVMKNALDWLVSDMNFPELPVAFINTSPRAIHAQAALREVLTTMSANIIEDACVAVPLLGSDLDEAGIVKHPEISELLIQAMKKFHEAIVMRREAR